MGESFAVFCLGSVEKGYRGDSRKKSGRSRGNSTSGIAGGLFALPSQPLHFVRDGLKRGKLPSDFVDVSKSVVAAGQTLSKCCRSLGCLARLLFSLVFYNCLCSSQSRRRRALRRQHRDVDRRPFCLLFVFHFKTLRLPRPIAAPLYLVTVSYRVELKI